jgi:NAD-dependent deacetylase
VDQRVIDIIERAAGRSGPVVFLTGAGISAESGIPTFRGEEGYWVVGSREYRPQEMATSRAFAEMPDEVWGWYLYRRNVCRAAEPNPAHAAIAELETTLGDGMLLVTQNIDGLHLRAGSSLERTYQIHGNLDFYRCARACGGPVLDPLDPEVVIGRGEALSAALREKLLCRRCAELGRPHVLWFDECYDEPLFRFESSLRAAAEARLLVTVGTAGATNLPSQMVHMAVASGASVIDVNPYANPFGDIAESRGAWICGRSGDVIPELCAQLAAALG